MENNDRRCGTCRWWKQHEGSDVSGQCEFQLPPVPIALLHDWDFTCTNHGRDCPCWERRERTLNGFPIVISDLDLDGKPLKEQQP